MKYFNYELTKQYFYENRALFLEKSRLKGPSWIKGSTDPLGLIYSMQEDFFRKGELYFGCIVQANVKLYNKWGITDCPASVLY